MSDPDHQKTMAILQGINDRLDKMLVKVDSINVNMREISTNLERITNNLSGFNLGDGAPLNIANLCKG